MRHFRARLDRPHRQRRLDRPGRAGGRFRDVERGSGIPNRTSRTGSDHARPCHSRAHGGRAGRMSERRMARIVPAPSHRGTRGPRHCGLGPAGYRARHRWPRTSHDSGSPSSARASSTPGPRWPWCGGLAAPDARPRGADPASRRWSRWRSPTWARPSSTRWWPTTEPPRCAGCWSSWGWWSPRRSCLRGLGAGPAAARRAARAGHQRPHSREGAHPRAPALRGPGLLRPAHPRPARGVGPTHLGGDRALPAGPERPHPRRLRRAAGVASPAGRCSGWCSPPSPPPSPRCASAQLAFRLRNWRSPESRRLLYLEYVLANDEHAKEVKLFGLGPMLLDRYRIAGRDASTRRTGKLARAARELGHRAEPGRDAAPSTAATR